MVFKRIWGTVFKFLQAIEAPTGVFTNLTDGYIPYHISDASGLGDSPLFTDGTDVGLNGTIGATTGIFVNLADGYIPYHISDALGLGDSPINTDGTHVGIGTIELTERLNVDGNILLKAKP